MKTKAAAAQMNTLSTILERRYESQVTFLALMSLGLIERLDGGWRLTDAGRFTFFS